MIVGLLGAGRLGRTMEILLPAAGHAVRVWRRGEPFPDCDVAWLTVSDGAIAQVAAALPPGPVVLHASGATPFEVLRPHRPAGSLHPLQSFPGPEVAIPPVAGVPAAVAGDLEAAAIATQLAHDLGFAPFDVPGDRRLYHAAAVVAGNFATVLLGEAGALLTRAGVAPDRALEILAPLALASIRQAAERGAAAALTGPYARRDAAVVAAHLAAIRSAHPAFEDAYRALGARAVALLDGEDESTRALARLLEHEHGGKDL